MCLGWGECKTLTLTILTTFTTFPFSLEYSAGIIELRNFSVISIDPTILTPTSLRGLSSPVTSESYWNATLLSRLLVKLSFTGALCNNRFSGLVIKEDYVLFTLLQKLQKSNLNINVLKILNSFAHFSFVSNLKKMISVAAYCLFLNTVVNICVILSEISF